MGPQVGDFVKKGQTLFTVDRDVLLAKQRQAQFTVDSLSNEIESEKERMEKAMESYLAAAGDLDLGIVSSDLVSKQLLTMDESQEKSERAKALLAKAQKELAMIDLELKKTALSCPFDAIVLKKAQDLGAVVSVGDPIYTICKPDYLWVEAEVLEKDLGKIAIGTQAKIRLIAYPDKELRGTVSYIGPATVAKSANLPFSGQRETVPIKVSIENLSKILKPGLSAQVVLYRS
jgi:multidrug resistance efflux pump